MSDKWAELLKQLAEKLGTTAEHLWAVLVRQAQVSFWSDIVWYGLVAVGVLALVVTATKAVHNMRRMWTQHEGAYFDDAEDFEFGLSLVAAMLSSVVAFIFVWASLSSIEDTITKRYNPEYWALQQVSKVFK